MGVYGLYIGKVHGYAALWCMDNVDVLVQQRYGGGRVLQGCYGFRNGSRTQLTTGMGKGKVLHIVATEKHHLCYLYINLSNVRNVINSLHQRPYCLLPLPPTNSITYSLTKFNAVYVPSNSCSSCLFQFIHSRESHLNETLHTAALLNVCGIFSSSRHPSNPPSPQSPPWVPKRPRLHSPPSS